MAEDKEPTAVERDMERFSKIADRLKLKGKDRDEYIHDHMTGVGYRSKRTYVEKDDDDEGRTRYSTRRRRRNDDDDDDL